MELHEAMNGHKDWTNDGRMNDMIDTLRAEVQVLQSSEQMLTENWRAALDELRELARGIKGELADMLRRDLPWPEDIFVMTVEQYVKEVPDEMTRTRVSGLMARFGWEQCVKTLEHILTEYEPQREESE